MRVSQVNGVDTMNWLTQRGVSAMLPATDALAGIAPETVRVFVVRLMAESTWGFKVGMWVSALMWLITPIFTVFAPLPAVLLPAGLADRHASRMARHRLYLVRQCAGLLKLVAGMAWAIDPDVRERMTLPPLADDPGEWMKAS